MNANNRRYYGTFHGTVNTHITRNRQQWSLPMRNAVLRQLTTSAALGEVFLAVNGSAVIHSYRPEIGPRFHALHCHFTLTVGSDQPLVDSSRIVWLNPVVRNGRVVLPRRRGHPTCLYGINRRATDFFTEAIGLPVSCAARIDIVANSTADRENYLAAKGGQVPGARFGRSIPLTAVRPRTAPASARS